MDGGGPACLSARVPVVRAGFQDSRHRRRAARRRPDPPRRLVPEECGPTPRRLWATRVQQDQHALVFLGDSITDCWGDDLGGSFPGVKVANRGIGGDTTRGVLIRLQEDVLSLHPAGVVLLIGTNDLADGAAPEVITGN